jgi:hypothetical protein
LWPYHLRGQKHVQADTGAEVYDNLARP